jgi:hypothetical protein
VVASSALAGKSTLFSQLIDPCSKRMFRTVPLEIFNPSFLSLPRIRPNPQPFSLAIWMTNCRTSSGFRGRPGLAGLLPFVPFSPLIHRENVLGVAIVISSLIADQMGLPTFMSFSRSAGVIVIRLGSLLRRIRFSVLRYSTYRINWGWVARTGRRIRR